MNTMAAEISGGATGPSTQGMAELLEASEALHSPQRGEVVEGVVMSVGQDGILVHVGHKSEGIILQREMRSLPVEEFSRLQVGDKLLVSVVQLAGDDGQDDGQMVLSYDRARGERAWRILENSLQGGQSVKGQITGVNKGGVVVDVDGVQGFVPLSQLAPIPKDHSDNQQFLAQRVGEIVELQVLEVNRRRQRAVLSERGVLQARREKQKAQLLETLKEGEIRHGRVSGISNFGAFVDLGGADGLIHISELSWTPIRSTEDAVHVGDEVEVYVLKVDKETKRIALSLRRMKPEPWIAMAQKYQIGQEVSGTVTRLMPYGAFARIEDDNVEGLIHISELSDRRINHPKEVVKEGEVVKLRIVSIEPERRRVGLSLRQAQEYLEGEHATFP